MKIKIFLALSIIFSILTFIGAGYVLANRGTATGNAGYAVIPMLFAIVFSGAYRSSKK